MALSSDGNTLAVGGPYDDGGKGATWIFVSENNGSDYQQLGPKLVQSSARQGKMISCIIIRTSIRECSSMMMMIHDFGGTLGFSVALSSNGSTLAVGSPFDEDGKGATWVFVLVNKGTTTSYEQLGTKLVGNGWVYPARQGNKHNFCHEINDFDKKNLRLNNTIFSVGWSVSLSSNGSILAVGGPVDGPSYTDRIGSTWLFEFNGSRYNQLGDKLVGTKYLGYSSQGKNQSSF